MGRSRSKKIKLYLQGNKSEVSKKLGGADIATADDEKNLLAWYFQLADCGGFELIGFQSNSKRLTVLE